MRILLILTLISFIPIAFFTIGCTEEGATQNNVTDVNGLNPKIAVFKDDTGWKAQVTFVLPNPCHKIEYDGKVVTEKEILLKYKHTPPEAGVSCVQVIETYNETISIGYLSEGEYSVILFVNGENRKDFSFVV